MIFSNIKENEYKIHFITYSNYGCPIDNRRLVMRFFESGVEKLVIIDLVVEITEQTAIFTQVVIAVQVYI